MMSVRGAAVAVLMVAASAAMGQGAGAVYDGFAGPAGADLGGWSGGAGWAGPWVDYGMGIPTTFTGPSAGLGFGDLTVTAGAITTPGRWLPDMAGYARAYPGVTGDVLYLSFLMRPEADATNWQILRLGNWPRQVDVGVPIGFFSYGLMVGDGLMVDTPVPVIIGTTVLLVLEVKHDLGQSRTVYSLYVDPAPGGGKPAFPMGSFARAGIMDFGASLEMRGEGGYSLDEVRIGTTWESVTPAGPAVCPADLNGDGLVDFADYLEFLNLYDALDLRVDFTGDGLVDFSDYLEFLNLYDAGC
ncbi:MAG: EF-hand domain-containing protein [Phycisphaerales bacterium]|nr:EF-hand domain-containing protein [Phycisphaerales bacterium]